MVYHCSICKSTSDTKLGGHVSTFALPRDPYLRKQWYNNLPEYVYKRKTVRICQFHFREEDVIKIDRVIIDNEVREFPRKKYKLKPNAVPVYTTIVPPDLVCTSKNLSKNYSKTSTDDSENTEYFFKRKRSLLDDRIITIQDISDPIDDPPRKKLITTKHLKSYESKLINRVPDEQGLSDYEYEHIEVLDNSDEQSDNYARKTTENDENTSENSNEALPNEDVVKYYKNRNQNIKSKGKYSMDIQTLSDIADYYQQSEDLQRNWIFLQESNKAYLCHISLDTDVALMDGSVCFSEDLKVVLAIEQEKISHDCVPKYFHTIDTEDKLQDLLKFVMRIIKKEKNERYLRKSSDYEERSKENVVDIVNLPQRILTETEKEIVLSESKIDNDGSININSSKSSRETKSFVSLEKVNLKQAKNSIKLSSKVKEEEHYECAEQSVLEEETDFEEQAEFEEKSEFEEQTEFEEDTECEGAESYTKSDIAVEGDATNSQKQVDEIFGVDSDHEEIQRNSDVDFEYYEDDHDPCSMVEDAEEENSTDKGADNGNLMYMKMKLETDSEAEKENDEGNNKLAVDDFEGVVKSVKDWKDIKSKINKIEDKSALKNQIEQLELSKKPTQMQDKLESEDQNIPEESLVKSSENGNLLECSDCHMIFTHKDKFLEHIPHCGNIVGFSCGVCDIDFKSQPELQNHMIQVHDEVIDEIFDCPHCDKRCDDREAQQQHINEHLDEMGLAVEFYDEDEKAKCEPAALPRSPRIPKIRTRIVSATEESQPPEDNNATEDYDATEEYDTTEENDAIEENDAAEENYATEEHEATEENAEDNEDASSYFNEDEDQTLKAIFAICGICQKEFKSKSGYRNHFIRAHPSEAKETISALHKTYPCPHCASIYKSAIALDGHVNGHNGEKPYKCDVCEKSYQSKISLYTHSKIHTAERTMFQCRFCAQVFSQKVNCVAHMRLHTGEKPFVCPDCDRAFAFPGLLKTHQRVHWGIKPYECPVCARKFHEKSALNKHQKRQNHEGEPVIDDTVIKISNFRKKQLAAGNANQSKISQKEQVELSPTKIRRQVKEQARES